LAPLPWAKTFYTEIFSLINLLGCSKANVSVQIKQGKIPAVRIGAYPYIPREWVDQQREAAYASLQGGK
jgi:hypothetical protein